MQRTHRRDNEDRTEYRLESINPCWLIQLYTRFDSEDRYDIFLAEETEGHFFIVERDTVGHFFIAYKDKKPVDELVQHYGKRKLLLRSNNRQ